MRRVWVAASLGGVLLAAGSTAQQEARAPAVCVERRLDELGYVIRGREAGETGPVLARRRIVTSTAVLREFGAVAAWLSTQLRPGTRHDFDQLAVRLGPGGAEGLKVVATTVTVEDGRESEGRPRARALKDAVGLLARCGRSGPR